MIIKGGGDAKATIIAAKSTPVRRISLAAGGRATAVRSAPLARVLLIALVSARTRPLATAVSATTRGKPAIMTLRARIVYQILNCSAGPVWVRKSSEGDHRRERMREEQSR